MPSGQTVIYITQRAIHLLNKETLLNFIYNVDHHENSSSIQFADTRTI